MTITELIDILSKYHPETRVMINGYEGGLEDVKRIQLVHVQLDVFELGIFGPHDRVWFVEDPFDIEAVLFERNG